MSDIVEPQLDYMATIEMQSKAITTLRDELGKCSAAYAEFCYTANKQLAEDVATITTLRAEVAMWKEAARNADAPSEALRAEIERLRAALEWALDNAGTDHPRYPYRVPDDVWASPCLVSGAGGFGGGVGEEHFATALEAVEAALAQEKQDDR